MLNGQRVRQVFATTVALVCFMTLDVPARQQPPDDWFSRVPAGRSVVRSQPRHGGVEPAARVADRPRRS